MIDDPIVGPQLTFPIIGTKPYVPVVSLSNAKLLKQINVGFNKTIDW